MLEKNIKDLGFQFKYIITSPHSELAKRIYRKDNIFLSWQNHKEGNYIELLHRIDNSIGDFDSIDLIPSFKQRVLFSGIIIDGDELRLIIEWSYNRLVHNDDKITKQ